MADDEAARKHRPDGWDRHLKRVDELERAREREVRERERQRIGEKALLSHRHETERRGLHLRQAFEQSMLDIRYEHLAGDIDVDEFIHAQERLASMFVEGVRECEQAMAQGGAIADRAAGDG